MSLIDNLPHDAVVARPLKRSVGLLTLSERVPRLSVHSRATRIAVSVGVFVVVLALIIPHLMDVNPPFTVDVLLAPTWLMGGLVGRLIPTGNIGTPDDPVYEATPIHMLVGLTVAFFNIVLYPVLTYVVLSLVSKVLKRRVSQQ